MTTKNLDSALLGVQKKLEAVSKSADNPFYKSKYADLNVILEATKPLLNEAGIVILQPVGRDTLGHFVETQLIHSSGESRASRMYLTDNAGADMQKLGAAVTYARRYGLQSFLVMESEDDDGETAVGRGKGFGGATKTSAPKSKFTPSTSANTSATGPAPSNVTAASVPVQVPQVASTVAVNSATADGTQQTAAATKPSSFKRPASFLNGKTKGPF